MPYSPDPYTEAYRAVFDALESADAPLAALVSRFVDVTEEDIPEKAECDALPMVIVAQSGFTWSPGSSKARTSVQNFPILMSTGSAKLGTVNAVKWAAIRALEIAGSQLGKPGLIESWRMADWGDAYQMRAERLGAERWITSGVVAVTLKIDKSELPAASGS